MTVYAAVSVCLMRSFAVEFKADYNLTTRFESIHDICSIGSALSREIDHKNMVNCVSFGSIGFHSHFTRKPSI